VKVKEQTSTILNAESNRSAWVQGIVDYILARQNDDGGYAFAQGLDSNAQDTYYGLAILNLLSHTFPNLTKTVKWLHEFAPSSLFSHYYVTEALRLCNSKPVKNLKEFLLSLHVAKGEFETEDVYVEIASEFETSFMFTKLVRISGINIDREKMTRGLLNYQNKDGGFGAHGHSNINSTYHAVASLFNLGYSVKSLSRTLDFVRSCEDTLGIFTIVPQSAFPYMEHEYYGVSTLGLFGEHVKHPEEIAQFVYGCQKSNGGFARADLGISTFEDTFYAVNILRKIGRL
jgi:hypothetical protein